MTKTKPFNSTNLHLIYDAITKKQLMLIGMVCVIGINLAILFFLVRPFQELVSIEQSTVTLLESQVQQSENLEQAKKDSLSDPTLIPEVIGEIRLLIEGYQITIDELVVNPVPLENPKYGFYATKIIVSGERERIFQAIKAAQQSPKIPLLIQGLDVGREQGVIELSLLYKSTSDEKEPDKPVLP